MAFKTRIEDIAPVLHSEAKEEEGLAAAKHDVTQLRESTIFVSSRFSYPFALSGAWLPMRPSPPPTAMRDAKPAMQQ